MSSHFPLRFSHNHHLLAVKDCGSVLDVLAFEGTEALSTPFSYRIEFTSSDHALSKEMMLRKAASLTLQAPVDQGHGAEMTAVMAQSPGPLQLLPGTAYGKGWLSIEGVEKPLPNSEPYTEIYTRRSAWWAMCEDRFINPDNKILDKPKLEKDWLNYDLLITNKVRPFIDSLHGHFHKNTYAFYGNDGKKYPSYGSLRWLDISSKNISDAYKEKISGKGAIFSPTYLHNKTTRLVGMTTGDKGKLYRKFKLSSPEDAGDGTVPVSAAVIESPNLMSQLGVSVDHEGAYGTENTQDARWFTLRSILKIAQAVNDTGLAYDK